MKLKPISWFVLVLALFQQAAPVARAEDTPAATAPSAADTLLPGQKSPAELFSRFVVAMGGEEAIRKNNTRLSKGKILLYSLNVEGTVETTQVAPRKISQQFNLTGMPAFTMASDGTSAWVDVTGVGVTQLTGDELEQFLDEADLFKELNLTKRYVETKLSGSQSVNDVECDVVIAKTAKGETELLYFGRGDGLLRRWDHNVVTKLRAKFLAETYFDDYRAVDGLKLPFRIRQTKPAESAYDLIVTSIAHGVTPAAAKFEKPKK